MRPSTQRSSALTQWGSSFSNSLARAFPTPSLLLPQAAGFDISDSSIKWIVLSNGEHREVQSYGELPLEAGIVVSGSVQDVAGLSRALAQVKKELGSVSCAHAALPEELAYVFSMHVPYATPRTQALRMIEFGFDDRVPIPPSAAVYDYNILSYDGVTSDEVGVVVFPKDAAEAYVDAFDSAGITLLSLEVEARSIARAVSRGASSEPITLLVDFGRARTGFSVLKYGLPIFSSTVTVGGEAMTAALMQELSLTAEQAEEYKNEVGLIQDKKEKSPGFDIILKTASALSDEIARHYRYWDTRRNDHGERVTPVGRVLLVGGSSNLRGLPDFIASKVQATVERGDVWKNVVSYDAYIPPIVSRQSLQFATAIGLALRGLPADASI